MLFRSVPDRDDIDDDNDGVLDYNEYECGNGEYVNKYVIGSGLGMGFGGSYNNGNNRGTATYTMTNLSTLSSVVDAGAAAFFKVNDANGVYAMRAALAPTNGILSTFRFGPKLSGNTTNAAIVNGQQTIKITWNYPIGGYEIGRAHVLNSSHT